MALAQFRKTRRRDPHSLLRRDVVHKAAMLCLLILVTVPMGLRQASAAPVAVRFVEGVTHGFLFLRNVDGELLASGQLLQFQRGGQVESRMVFRFKDGSAAWCIADRHLPRTPRSRWSDPPESTA
jgi:hypothetical protein